MKYKVKYRPSSKVIAAKAPYQVSELIKEIQDTIYNVASKYLKVEGWDMSDIADYFVVDVQEVEPGVIRAEIRGELDYDGLSGLCNQLDKAIAVKFDKDAYFEPVEPGIAEAFIRTNVKACSNVTASLCTSTKTKVTASWDEDDSEWIKLNRKYVLDSDGFYTDYTLYTNGHEYICMFGDEDIYGPDPDYADFSTDSEEEAMEWFDSYEGMDEDIQATTDDELEHPDQDYDSAATSINSNKLPAIYKMVNFEPGKVYLDFGGGKFDNGVYFVKDKGATLLVYDPYNRSDEHNKQVLAELKENGGADAGLNSNVLNVIKEPQARLAVLKNLKRLVKPGGDIYITVYEGTGKGDERPTKAGYQLNRKTEGYMDEVRQIFPDAQRKGKLIHAVNSSTQPITITSGTVTDKVYWYFTRHGVQPGSIPKSIDTLYDVIDTPEGTYFATNTILNTKELSQYEIKEKWLPEKYKDQTDYFEHNRVVSAADCSAVSDDQYLTYCPNCHGDRFNNKTGLCLDCGYDEKSWGTGSYYDQSYDDDFDDYDHDYEPSHNHWNELYDVSSSDQLDDSIIDAEDLRGLSREQIEQILDEAPVGAEVIHIRNLKNRFNMDAHIEKKSEYQANYYQGMGTPLDFKDEDTFWEVGAYKDPYIDDTIYKAVNGMDRYYGLTSEVLKAHGITSASYGGAYDILDELDHKGVARDQYSDQYVPYDSIANYVHDHYSFEELDDKYSCINSLLQSFKGEDRIAKDIIEQFVRAHNGTDAVTSANDIGYSSFQDARLQPPEYDEPEEESTEELVEFSFDEIVNVDSDGCWEYEDRSYKFARNPDTYDGDWYTEDFNVYFRDVTGVVEDMDSVLEKNMPMRAGRYRITGDANLYYNVSGIQVYTDYYGPDDYDQTIVQDGVDVQFNYGKSHIDNLVVQKLD